MAPRFLGRAQVRPWFLREGCDVTGSAVRAVICTGRTRGGPAVGGTLGPEFQRSCPLRAWRQGTGLERGEAGAEAAFQANRVAGAPRSVPPVTTGSPIAGVEHVGLGLAHTGSEVQSPEVVPAPARPPGPSSAPSKALSQEAPCGPANLLPTSGTAVPS